MEPELLWTPSPAWAETSNLHAFTSWVGRRTGKTFGDYASLHQWSVDSPSDFWRCIWDYFHILHDGTVTEVFSQEPMPKTRWFPGTALNYAEHIFRNATDRYPAIVFSGENKPVGAISWKTLISQVASVQQTLRSLGIGQGDTVAAYTPCIPEATVAMLATTSLGATWSSCSPDFGSQSVIDRFAQIRPKVLFASGEYAYNGKRFMKTDTVREIVSAIPEIAVVIDVVPGSFDYGRTNMTWEEASGKQGCDLIFTRVPFDHPLWILYSSGTTGLPKAITHSHGGILLEQLKYGTFHNDFKPGERCFWYTTTGWMMWNYIHGSLLSGATMVIYDGSPAWPDLNVLWRFCEDASIAHFGTSAAFILSCAKEGIAPRTYARFPELRSVGSTGSTLPPEGFRWIYKNIKDDLWLASMSGGTDVCSAFVGGNPTLPVFAGEIQCRALGCALEVWDESGSPLTDEEGEMVITRPMPSMPVFFWNDPEYIRYTESYFENYPGVWRHGDWIRLTPRGGVVIYGRSDATLNRGGVRIGTSEVYRATDQVPELADSLIVCIEKANGEFWMPLFVKLRDGFTLDDDLKKRIALQIRTACSPRHVPDVILEVPDIPYTISGKKTETPVKKILMGRDVKKAVSTGSLRNPESLAYFTEIMNSNPSNPV